MVQHVPHGIRSGVHSTSHVQLQKFGAANHGVMLTKLAHLLTLHLQFLVTSGLMTLVKMMAQYLQPVLSALLASHQVTIPD